MIVNPVTGEVIGRGELRQGLYYLQNDKSVGMAMTWQSSKKVQNDKSGKESENQFATWHKRLGHASISKLQHIDCVKPFLSLKKEPVCITCPLSKMTKLSFPASLSHASAPFELIHTDIWGPYKVATRGRFRFFLTFVDDCSRMTWVYLLEKKSDYLNTLMTFEEYIFNQFNGKI